DVLPAAQGLGYQQMRVGQQGHDASLANVLSEASAFGLSAASARRMAAHIAQQVAQWKSLFQDMGVCAADLEILAQYLDGAHLTTQRREALSGGFMS
ncbi:MAG: type II toxin-antitoxin system HipA family toxin, partial [Hydrogenophaga sp.]|nr:type II toxin-antitoxin system HipA family toxin [Hydrogenophaga sp.]